MSCIRKCITFTAVLAVVLGALTNPAWAGRGPGGKGDSSKLPELLTDAEVAGLVFMREEEKLARDVYLDLYDAWGLTVFSNISKSEQKHTDAIELLLEKYGVTDPVPEDAEGIDSRGVYEDPDLQALYDFLMGVGIESSTRGLVVGATIEEKDIVDIQEKIEKADQEDIISTYESLMCGSRNHLRAFMQNLDSVGEPYEPQFLDPEEFDAILDGSLETDCGSY